MEYGVDFNRIRKLQPVGMRRDDFFNLIRASIFPIEFLGGLVCIQISCIQLNRVTNLVGRCWGMILVCYSFVDKLSPCYLISKELL